MSPFCNISIEKYKSIIVIYTWVCVFGLQEKFSSRQFDLSFKNFHFKFNLCFNDCLYSSERELFVEPFCIKIVLNKQLLKYISKNLFMACRE